MQLLLLLEQGDRMWLLAYLFARFPCCGGKFCSTAWQGMRSSRVAGEICAVGVEGEGGMYFVYALGSEDSAFHFYATNLNVRRAVYRGLVQNGDGYLTGVRSMFIRETLYISNPSENVVLTFSIYPLKTRLQHRCSGRSETQAPYLSLFQTMRTTFMRLALQGYRTLLTSSLLE